MGWLVPGPDVAAWLPITGDPPLPPPPPDEVAAPSTELLGDEEGFTLPPPLPDGEPLGLAEAEVEGDGDPVGHGGQALMFPSSQSLSTWSVSVPSTRSSAGQVGWALELGLGLALAFDEALALPEALAFDEAPPLPEPLALLDGLPLVEALGR